MFLDASQKTCHVRKGRDPVHEEGPRPCRRSLPRPHHVASPHLYGFEVGGENIRARQQEANVQHVQQRCEAFEVGCGYQSHPVPISRNAPGVDQFSVGGHFQRVGSAESFELVEGLAPWKQDKVDSGRTCRLCSDTVHRIHRGRVLVESGPRARLEEKPIQWLNPGDPVQTARKQQDGDGRTGRRN